MSRPNFKPTKDQRKLVRYLAAIGLRHERIASVVGIRSPKTLRKHFRKDIAEGTAEATATITAAACEMAVSGKYPVMTRFWLSTVGRGPAMLFDPAGQDNRSEVAEEDSADAEEQISAD
jgi:hypothetical protein